MWQVGGRWRGDGEEWRLGRSNLDSTRRSAEESVGSTEWELRSTSERARERTVEAGLVGVPKGGTRSREATPILTRGANRC
jgi:hypothetical protein